MSRQIMDRLLELPDWASDVALGGDRVVEEDAAMGGVERMIHSLLRKENPLRPSWAEGKIGRPQAKALNRMMNTRTGDRARPRPVCEVPKR